MIRIPKTNYTKKFLQYFLFVFLIFLICCSVKTIHNWDEIRPEKFTTFWVSAIIQGDIIRLSDGIVVQYAGIRSPSRGEPYFNECRNANAQLLDCKNPDDFSLHKKVALKFLSSKPSPDGTYQALVYFPVAYDPKKGMLIRFVNKELLEFGYAMVDPNFNSHPYSKEFLEAQEIAKTKKRGLWEFK